MTRLLWYVALACLAVLVVGLQLDRQSRITPSLAVLVPGPFQADAHRPLLALAAARQDYATAFAHARGLINDRPYPAENLSFLAQIEAQRGHNEEAAMALTAAGRRGWRDPVTQTALAASALMQRDFDQAALRTDALLSTRQATETAILAVENLLSTKEGTDAFARRLAGRPRWLNDFVTGRMTPNRPEDVAKALAAAEELGAKIECSALIRADRYLQRRANARTPTTIPARCTE